MGKELNLSRCKSGKIRYRDKLEAVKFLHRIQHAARNQFEAAGWTARKECRAYFCPTCQGFHLTSQEGKFQFWGKTAW